MEEYLREVKGVSETTILFYKMVEEELELLEEGSQR